MQTQRDIRFRFLFWRHHALSEGFLALLVGSGVKMRFREALLFGRDRMLFVQAQRPLRSHGRRFLMRSLGSLMLGLPYPRVLLTS
jgi:hypothetical protein